MRYSFSLLISIFSVAISFGQSDLKYYLPSGVEYNDNIPTPKEVIGHEVGEWHISHDRLVNYMYRLAQSSDRLIIKEIGRTFETRPLLNLIITSEENHEKLEVIQEEHLKLSDPSQSANLDIANMPAVAYLGYSIHGNEPSGSNSALVLAYYLAAAQGSEIENLLKNTVIILDPSLNPDGLNRFANYVNARKSLHQNNDPNNMEQNEPWPKGRTNHYWFDMNRDWLPVQLPESRARINVFHKWKPNVLTDHHEMGSNSTFFFQPGIPSRNNPLTPANTFRLTEKMGEYHAKALDKIGSLYYTKESFDDYYYGKGSTYPDINGAVGILFEQASSRGHSRETVNGILKFPFTIRNHFTVSLSTLEALYDMRKDFLEHQRTFYRDAKNEGQKSTNKGFIFGSKDRYRNYHLAELISRHNIKVYKPQKSISARGKLFQTGDSYYVSLNQDQHRLIKAMFETRTKFKDSLFYDVSTWTLPLAFGLDYSAVNSKSYSNALTAAEFDKTMKPKGQIIGGQSDYAYAFEWDQYYTPKALNWLLSKNYKVKVAHEPFHNSDGKKFERGTILIPLGIQKRGKDLVFSHLTTLAKTNGLNIYALNTGLDYKGVSLGSPNFASVRKPKVALLVEGGVTPYDAGEVWHLFDQRYDMDLSLLPISNLSRVDLGRYSTLVMVNGSYSGMTDSGKKKIKQWTQNGGTVIAIKSAMRFVNSLGIASFDFKKTNRKDSANWPYADISKHRGAQRIGGAIFEASIDNTHPLLYGYENDKISLFRNSELFLERSKKAFANPVVYAEKPLLSGYISKENLNHVINSSAVGISKYGRGKVIGFVDNPNFRAFWYGTNKMFMNAIFFGSGLNTAATR